MAKLKLVNMSHLAALARERRDYKRVFERGEGKVERILRHQAEQARKAFERPSFQANEFLARECYAATAEYLAYCGWGYTSPLERKVGNYL